MKEDFEGSDKISRKLPFILCLISVFLCFLYDYLRTDLPPWWKQVGGGIPYVLFWILLCFVVLPRRKFIFPICIGVTLFTCLLEFLQLWKPEPLVALRQTRIGAALLGSQFSWSDMPPYFIGGVIGFVLLHLLFYLEAKRSRLKPDLL